MKTIFQKIAFVGAGLLLATNGAVHAQNLYNDSTTDTGNSLNFVNGTTLGNEIVMGYANPYYSLTDFSFEYYSPLATFTGVNVQMEVYLYANDGSPFNGYATPGTSLYDSGLFSLSTPQQYSASFPGGPVNAVALDFDLSASPVTVPRDFTLAVVVTGLTGGDTAGIELFDPPTTGQNYGDYWSNNGGGWQLLTNTVPTDFGAQFSGTPTPEPSSAYLGVAGGTLLAGLTWLRRRQASSKPN
jgi:hypothetical protein